MLRYRVAGQISTFITRVPCHWLEIISVPTTTTSRCVARL